jgi:tripartite-type tricarboxylate transporter receptor subunit TctC
MSRVLVAVAAAVCLTACIAHAQPYPSKTVRIVVTLTPGSPSDVVARLIAEQLAKSLKQPFVIENRPGAGGNIAGEYVIRQPADGYTLMLASISSHGINPAWYAKMPYDALRDFTPIIALASSPSSLVVNNDVPANSVRELVAWVKSTNGVNYASAGNGTSLHVAGELFNAVAGAKVVHVPYKGGPEAVLAVMRGEVAMIFIPIANVLPLVKSGKLKMLGVTTPQRVTWLPEVPTVAEAGLPGFDVTVWYGFVAPAGTPSEVVRIINTETQKALALPAVRESLSRQGFEIMGGSPQEFASFMKADIEKWSRLVKTANLPKL